MSIPYRDPRPIGDVVNDFIKNTIEGSAVRIQDPVDPIDQLRRFRETIDEIERQEFLVYLSARRQIEERVVSRWIPRGRACLIAGTLYMHPVDDLHIKYPNSPVWSKQTLGHRELERDRRRHPRS